MSPVPLASGGRFRAVILLLVLALAAGACVSFRRDDQFGVRSAEYLEQRQAMSPAVADAMAIGHVVAGMDREQVVVVLGRPIERVSYGGTPPVEVWLYPGHRLHQDHHRSGNAFRAVSRDVSQAARDARIPRGTFYRLLKKHDIDPAAFRNHGGSGGAA